MGKITNKNRKTGGKLYKIITLSTIFDYKQIPVLLYTQ